MIPDHLIDQAAAAIYAASALSDNFAIDAWHDLADDNQVKTTTRIFARAALETVAAHIWDEGWERGMSYVPALERGADDDYLDRAMTNPYKASEGE